MKKKQGPLSLHLFELMCSGPVGLFWSSRLGKKALWCHKLNVDLPFPPPQLVQSGAGSLRNLGIDAVLHVCQFNTHRSIGAHIESCCVCIINMCVGVYVAQRPTWS